MTGLFDPMYNRRQYMNQDVAVTQKKLWEVLVLQDQAGLMPVCAVCQCFAGFRHCSTTYPLPGNPMSIALLVITTVDAIPSSWPCAERVYPARKGGD